MKKKALFPKQKNVCIKKNRAQEDFKDQQTKRQKKRNRVKQNKQEKHTQGKAEAERHISVTSCPCTERQGSRDNFGDYEEDPESCAEGADGEKAKDCVSPQEDTIEGEENKESQKIIVKTLADKTITLDVETSHDLIDRVADARAR